MAFLQYPSQQDNLLLPKIHILYASEHTVDEIVPPHLQSPLSAVRLETALADRHVFARRLASCLRALTVPSAARHTGMYSERFKLATARLDV